MPQGISSPEGRNLTPGFQLLRGVGVLELLEQDDRPTFVLDLHNPDNLKPGPLRPLYSNPALRGARNLYRLLSVGGGPSSEPSAAFAGFKTWAASPIESDNEGGGGRPSSEPLAPAANPSSLTYGGLSWSSSTIRKRFRVVKARGDVDAISPMPSGSAATTWTVADGRPEAVAALPLEEATPKPRNASEEGDYFGDTAMTSAADARPKAQSETYDRESGRVDSLVSAQGELAFESAYEETRPSFDWTRIPLDTPQLPDHFKFARSIDWASTSIGPIEHWPSQLRSMSNMVMGSPHPAALYWGEDYTAIYNEAYISIAGQKHPRLMGAKYKDAWSEIYSEVAPFLDSAWHSGQSTMKHDDRLLTTRNGFVEEAYFDWAIVPLLGADGNVVALYNPAFENTRRKVSERRMLTMREIGEKTSQAVDVGQFWAQLCKGLEFNVYDVPFALVYSVSEGTESEVSSMHSGSLANPPQVVLEGSLGVPDGHPAAVDAMDLRSSDEGFAPFMREAMAQPDTPVVLDRDAGTLPDSLIEGLAWRGFGDPSRTIVVFPVHPTTGRDAVVGFVVLGVNPRLRYDEDYQLFVHLLSRQLATSMASVLLFEEEIRRGQVAARLATQDRIELAQKLQMQTQQALESEYRFSKMAEFGPVGMFITDSQGQINYCNDMWWEISGHPAKSSQPSTLALAVWMESVRDEDRAGVEVVWAKLVNDKVAVTHELRFKGSRRVIDGHSVDTWVLMSAYPEKDALGELKSIFGCVTDISQQKWAQDLQKRRREEAAELKRQQENFIDISSHEMRNPLSAVLQCADEITLMIERHQLDPALENVPGLKMLLDRCLEAAGTISLCANHQKRIVDDILTLSKLDSKLVLLTPVDVQPVAVVQTLLRVFEPEFNANGIDGRFEIEQSYLDLAVDWVKLDPSRIHQVLINLLTNAVRFTQSRDIRSITVTLGASQGDPSRADFPYLPPRRTDLVDHTNEAEWGDGEKINIHLAVTDTSQGLDDQEKEELFHRFSQVSPRTHVQYGGVGLGLFVCQHLTELQGGQIGVTSEKGRGSTFAFYIKSRRGADPQQLDEQPLAPTQTASGGAPAQMPSLSTVSDATSSAPQAMLPSPISPTLLPIPDPYAPRPPFDVLIVEDNIVNQKVLERQLLICGSRTHVANHGAEALESLRRSRDWDGGPATDDPPNFAIILMDIEMPIMDGITCTKKIRELEDRGIISRRIPILAVTAYARDEQIETALAAGMVRLPPPFLSLFALLTDISRMVSCPSRSD